MIMAEGRYDINGDGVVDVSDVQSLATKILNGEGGKVSVGDAAKYALSASGIGMVSDNPSKAASNATALAKAISGGATAIVIDGTYHVQASMIECNRPLNLIGGKLVIHRHKEWYYWLVKIVEGFDVRCTDVTFEGVCDSGVSKTHHFHVFGNDTNVASTNPAYGANYTIPTIQYTGCKFKDVNALKLVFKVNESNDGKGAYSDCGIGDLLVMGCNFDNSTIHIMGGLIKRQCEIANCHVTNLNGSFFVHDRNVTGAVKQFSNNKPIVFHDNHLTTIQPSSADYVCAMIVKGHAARVYNNTFDNFLGLSVSDEDKEIMLADENLKQYVVGSELCALYDVYLSVADLEFHDNVITNMLAYRLDDKRSSYPNVSTCYSKQRYEKKAWKKIYRNRWEWDEAKCRSILSDAYDNILIPLSNARKAKGLSAYNISKENWIAKQYLTSLFDYVAAFDNIEFCDNVVSIPGGVIKGISMINNPCACGGYQILGNRFMAKRFDNALCRFQPRYTTEDAEQDYEIEGKTLKEWAEEVDSMPMSAIKSSGYPVRYIARNGEVVKIVQGTKTTYFPKDLFSVVVDGDKWQILHHECPNVMIAHNWFTMSDTSRFVVLFAGLTNIPTMGNNGYGDCSEFTKKTYGEIYVMRNILNVPYHVDPALCQTYRECGNDFPLNTKIEHHPYATASWRDLWMRNMTRETDAETLLPCSYGREGGNYIAHTFLLSGMVGEHTWVCEPRYTKSEPLRFALWIKNEVPRTMRLEYYKDGQRISKEMTLSGFLPLHVDTFDGEHINVEYTKTALIHGVDVTVAVTHGDGGSTVTGTQVYHTYISIYDAKFGGKLWITWK